MKRDIILAICIAVFSILSANLLAQRTDNGNLWNPSTSTYSSKANSVVWSLPVEYKWLKETPINSNIIFKAQSSKELSGIVSINVKSDMDYGTDDIWSLYSYFASPKFLERIKAAASNNGNRVQGIVATKSLLSGIKSIKTVTTGEKLFDNGAWIGYYDVSYQLIYNHKLYNISLRIYGANDEKSEREVSKIIKGIVIGD